MYANNQLELITIEELCDLLSIVHNAAYELLNSKKHDLEMEMLLKASIERANNRIRTAKE